MRNRLHLDFTIIDANERKRFLDEYLEKIDFIPTSDELETMGNYVLWGRAHNIDSNVDSNEDETLTPSSSKKTFNKKNTVAAKSGIEIKTSRGTWDSKEKAESLDALIEAPTFNEATLTNTPTHYTTPKTTFSRSRARLEAPPTIRAILEDLWKEIDSLELMLNFYDLRTGKRKNEPREELLSRFNEEEICLLRERSEKLNPYTYLKKRHELVELRKQQYTYRDSYAPTLLPSSYDYHPVESSSLSWDSDIDVLPLGLYMRDSKYSNLIFRLELDPEQYTAEELKYISSYYWKKINPTSKINFDFRNQEAVYQALLMVHELEEMAERDNVNHNIEGTNSALLDTLYFYIDFAELSDLQKDILRLKVDGVKNVDIADYINKTYGKTYTVNYISTIFRQKIIKKINEGAQYHLEVIENLFFPENFRKCNFCGRTLLLHSRNFVKKSKSATGFNSKCKRCEKERRDMRKKEKEKK